MSVLRHLDLFSGIGGFALGLQWSGGFETIGFCEIDKYCQKVLKKHWPSVPIYEDVTTLDYEQFTGQVDIITGGFPCQDISLAGPGTGLSGERSGLFREMVRAVRMVRPRYAFMENVAALLNRGMGEVCGSMAESGYDTEWDCIPACAIGAEHERDRIWIVAYPDSERELQQERGQQNEREWIGDSTQKDDAHIDSTRCEGRMQAGKNKKNERDIFPRLRSAKYFKNAISRDYWNYQPVLGRGVHGVSNRLDRIKGLGNSVVPQIVEILGRAISDVSINKGT